MEFRRVLFRSDTKEATVEVFPLAVTGQLPQWPEQGQRELRWFPVAEAAKAVDEPDLQSIIAAFREPPRDPGLFVRTLLRVKERQSESTGLLPWFHALIPKHGRIFERFEENARNPVHD